MINILKLVNVSKYYNKGENKEVRALNDINMEINKGDFISIMGPSGSGKSTLLHILACMDKPTSGMYFLDGKDVAEMSDKEKCHIRNKRIGIVLQDYGLLGNETVIRNICLPEIINGTYNSHLKRKALDILDKLEIGDIAYKKTNQLSGGQKQRVAIARTLVMGVDVILADEPTGALDSGNTEKLMELLSSLNKEGLTIVIVTHDMSVASVCTKQYELKDGELTCDK